MSNPTARDAVHTYLSTILGNYDNAEVIASLLDHAGFLITPGELDAIAKRQERERFEREIEWAYIPNNQAEGFRELPVDFHPGTATGHGIGTQPEFHEGYITYTRTSSPWKRTTPAKENPND